MGVRLGLLEEGGGPVAIAASVGAGPGDGFLGCQAVQGGAKIAAAGVLSYGVCDLLSRKTAGFLDLFLNPGFQLFDVLSFEHGVVRCR